MLAKAKVMATIAVRDLDAARTFYEGVLGFRPPGSGEEGAILYRSGTTQFLVYVSSYAGTNKATAATWAVGEDLEDTVRQLRSRGVAFEHYDDLPYMTRVGDIHEAGGTRLAWFKDPDGNILALTG